MFIDLVGSTPLSVVLDDESYSALIDDYRLMVSAAIARQGGTVQNDEGDGRFVWFGWPVAHRDDADRAVLMSLDVLEGIAPLARRVRTQVDRDLSLRIGIHTGPQIVHVPAGGGRPDARGGGVNLAAKVQQLCQPGELLISEATADMLIRPFTLEPHGVLTVDSLSGGIRLFQVTGTGEEPTELGPFAGRESELDMLRDRWARVLAGGAASIVLLAPAGLGKSRLIAELCARSDIPAVVHAVGDQRRVEDPLHALAEGLVRGGLLAAGAGPLSADEASQLLRTTAASGPMLLVVDDAQWLDASTIDVITELASDCPPNLMVLVASRPDAASVRWSEIAETVRLSPLDPSAAASLVDGIDDAGAISESTRATIIDRGGGNPLFLRWLAKSSSDSDYEGVRRILRPRSGVPVVIQHVLRSVLDDAGVDDMTTSTAAAIGTKFDAALLASVLDRPEDAVEADLRRLAAREIVRRGDLGLRSYQFSHSLIRDLAYDLLVPSECVRRHGRIADTLEAQQSTDYAMIGFHHDRAGHPEPAARAKLRAARICRTTGAYREGAALTARAIELHRGRPPRRVAATRGQRTEPPVRYRHAAGCVRGRCPVAAGRVARAALPADRPRPLDLHRQDQPMGCGEHDRRPSTERRPSVRRLPDRVALVSGDRPFQPVRAVFRRRSADDSRTLRSCCGTRPRACWRSASTRGWRTTGPPPTIPLPSGSPTCRPCCCSTVPALRCRMVAQGVGSARDAGERGVQHGAHLRELSSVLGDVG